ncbi:MAG: 30S ribosome-binding factor RbfA [Alphaproteobacteria bacterium]|tara:strand:+ start:116 stop:514 length:399 start_codon:yes stop_codon:yes gene_type:complete
MRNQNDLNLYKIKKESPRTQKIKQLIKRVLGEIFVSHDFRNSKGKSLIIFIDDVALSRDIRTANVFVTNFSKNEKITDEEILKSIDDNILKIKREFSKKIDLRYTPKLKFRTDSQRNKSFRLDELINNLSKN